jgi:predicted enzyme related to lactoylglutathione lyase
MAAATKLTRGVLFIGRALAFLKSTDQHVHRAALPNERSDAASRPASGRHPGVAVEDGFERIGARIPMSPIANEILGALRGGIPGDSRNSGPSRRLPWLHTTTQHMNSPLCTVIVYARDMKKTAVFYSEHFGFKTTGEVTEGLIELHAPNGGAGILIHQAAKSVKLGQVGVKLSFQVHDVRAFVIAAAEKGLEFGAVHEANGYQFANAKDPDKNPVSISSRAFRSGG